MIIHANISLHSGLLGEEDSRLIWIRGRSEDGWPMGLWGRGEDRRLKGFLDLCKGDSELVGLLDREGLLRQVST